MEGNRDEVLAIPTPKSLPVFYLLLFISSGATDPTSHTGSEFPNS